MTLIVCCYTPTGIALSGDSRTTSVRGQQVPPLGGPSGAQPIFVQIPWVLSDNARKVFCLHGRFAVATWGEAFLNGLPIAHHINEYELATTAAQFPTVAALANDLMAHFTQLSPGLNVGFIVAGYDGKDPFVIEVNVAANGTKRWNADLAGVVQYGLFYGGDSDILQRLLSVAHNHPQFALMNLQDAVDLTRHLIRATIDQMRFEPRFATVGGHVDTITATPARTQFLVRKELRA